MTLLLIPGGAAAAAALMTVWFVHRRRFEVPCTLDLESTHDHLHAHVTLQGVQVEPGDRVTVHGAPSRIPYGEKLTLESEATVEQASWLQRQMIKVVGGREFYELYDVGFEG
jgi:hypothetical protein